VAFYSGTAAGADRSRVGAAEQHEVPGLVFRVPVLEPVESARKPSKELGATQTWRRQALHRLARDRRTPWVTRPEEADQWGAFLGGFPWDWFTTQTFPDVIGPDAAARLHKRWTRALEEFLGHAVRQARALEFQKRGVIHYHALLWGVHPDTRRIDWEGAWQEISGGYAAIYPYDPTRGARYYVGKYVAKGGEVDLLGPWWRGRGRDDHPRPTRPRGGDDAEPERR